MSTPSTATATLPLPHHQYYSRHQAYTPQSSTYAALNGSLVNAVPRLPNPQYSSAYTASDTIVADQRRTITASSRPSTRLPPVEHSHSLQTLDHREMNGSKLPRSSRSGNPSRQPNWDDYFKNGVPEEIIVIDDDTPEPAPRDRHADKKRKTGVSSNYDPVYNPQPSYSTTQTPYYENSSTNHTVSTDRTAPAYKGTGSSSTGPSITNRSYYPPLDEGVVGQKRKRAARVADDNKVVKRREVERVQSPFSAYIAPPKPPIKAREVYVKPIKDVRADRFCASSKLILW
jgi:dual-specificity kinase